MQLTRRKLTFGTAAVLALPGIVMRGHSARAAEFTFKIGMSVAKDHTAVQHLDRAAALMAEQSNGRINLQTYPSSQLGGDVDMLTQVHSGALEFQMVGGSLLNNIVPLAGINAVGFAFKNYQQVWAAMDGEVGALVRQALDKAGFFCHPASYDNGFRQLTTSRRQIKSVTDLKGLKVRVPIGPVWTSLWAALGAGPTSIDFSETYSALQTGIVDGQENALQQIESNKIYEVQKYCALTGHMWDGWWLIGHKDTWVKLPDDIKEIISRNFTLTAMEERKSIEDDTKRTQDHLTSLGMTFNEPDRDSFREKLATTTYYKDWHKKYGDEAWEAMEHYVGSMA